MKPAVVLILDNNKADLLLAKRVLAKEKLFNKIICFSQPKSAMDYLKHNRVDIVMVDMDLGSSTGLEFLRKAEKQKRLRGKTKIVISGVKDPDVVAQADLLGVAAWIDKPLNFSKLRYVTLHVPELFMSVVTRRTHYSEETAAP